MGGLFLAKNLKLNSAIQTLISIFKLTKQEKMNQLIKHRFLQLFLMLLFICSVTLNANAQNNTLNLNFADVPLEKVLNEIKKQTALSVVFNNKDVNTARKVSIKASNEKVSTVLDKLFKGTNIAYLMEDKYVVLSVKKDAEPSSQEKFPIKGKVTDNKGEPLIGVSIMPLNSRKGVSTSNDGSFQLSVSKGEVIEISYIGFAKQRITIQNDKPLIITLLEDSNLLDDVVVTALGIKRSQKALSYNLQEIKSAEITDIKDPNFINGLSGKIAGATINASSSGIGGATRVVMRGPKSINGSNNALYVIDGIPISNTNNGATEGEYAMQPRGEGISDLNPEDIESVTVLTGAAAAALYGSNAANGAILITTKAGKVGKPKVDISNSTTFMNPFVMPKFQNTYGNKPGSYSSWGDKLEVPSTFDPKDFFNTGTNIQNSASLSVGNERNQTYLSAASTDAAGIILNNKYKRYNFTFRNTTNFLDDKMTLDVGASYIIQNDQNMMAQGKYFNPLTAVYTFPRGESFDAIRQYERFDEGRNIMVQSWQYGANGLDMQNPYWVANRNLYGNKKDRYMLTAGLNYQILDWLKIGSRVRLDNSVNTYTKQYYASTSGLFAGPKGFYLKQNDRDNQLYTDVIVNINKQINDWSISANVGGSLNRNRLDVFGFQGPLKDVPNFFSSNNIDVAGRDARGYDELGLNNKMTVSAFASGELGWKNQLYLTVTGRNDWDSTLSGMPDDNFFYPSVGLSGVISEMLKLPAAISYLKVRASWASVGSGIPAYIASPTYKKDESTGKWITNTHMPIDKLYPERTNSWEFGLNSKFLGNKINLDLTYYHSNTTKQTFNMPISASSGYSSWYIQTGDVQNRGLELALGVNNTFGDLKWTSTYLLGFNENKIIKLFDKGLVDPLGNIVDTEQIGKGGILSSEIILKEGGTIGDMYTKTALKRDQEGNYWVDPATGGLVIENNVIQKVGSVLPKSNMSWRNDFTYKGVEFGFMFSARLGGVVVSPTQAILDGFGVSEATAIARDNGGIPVNNGNVDAQKWYEAIGTGGVLSHYVYSATNVRLQEARIGYTLPGKWFNNVMKMNVSVVGRNLWMIYNKAPFDPEVTASTGTYFQGYDYFMQPSLRNVGFSVKLQF